MGVAPWRTISSKDVVKDRWLHLTADECINGAGHTVAPFYVFHAADWVTVLALTPGDGVVLVNEYHHGSGSVLTGFPGGGMEVGETPEEAALRELKEETGYVSDDAIVVGAAWVNWGSHDNKVHFVIARGCRLVPGAVPAPGEENEVLVRGIVDVLANPPEQAFHSALLWHARHLVSVP